MKLKSKKNNVESKRVDTGVDLQKISRIMNECVEIKNSLLIFIDPHKLYEIRENISQYRQSLITLKCWEEEIQ